MTNAQTDMVMRVYEIVCLADETGQQRTFTVSLSMDMAQARVTDRDGAETMDEVWKRVAKVTKRDNIVQTPAGATFIRERLIPAAKANP